MGLESDEGEGVHTQDIHTAIEGFLQDGYKVRSFSVYRRDLIEENFWSIWSASRKWVKKIRPKTIVTYKCCFFPQFNPLSPVSQNDPGFRSNPTLEDQTFCIVNILAADKVSLMNEGVIDKLAFIREKATNLSKAGDYTPFSLC